MTTGDTPRRALITGITGQIGSYLAELLVERGYEVTGIVRGSPEMPRENLAAVQEPITLVQGDLLDQTTLLDAVRDAQPHELYNLAGTSFVPAFWEQPVATAQLTALGVTSMLEAVRTIDLSVRVFQASSGEIFGATTESPQRETTPFQPQTPYGIAKLYGHLMVASHRDRYGTFACSGILYNNESPRRSPDFLPRKVTRGAAAIKLGQASELRLGNLDATRDWGYAGDAVEAIWRSLQADEPGDYVISSGVSRSVRDLVGAAFRCVDLDPEPYVVVDEKFVRPADPVPLVGDPSKAKAELGWEPATSFDELIEMMVEHDLAELSGNLAPAAQQR